MYWNRDDLWQKSKVYAERALRERRDGPLFPFWCSLALEFLARAALARLHPALLADPRGDESVLYAFGYPAKKPKSVPMHTVLSRCRVVVPGFTKHEQDAALALVERRNEELHTGHPAFDGFPTSLWLGDFYRICKLLLACQGLDLADLLGFEEAAAAELMIAETDRAVVADAQRRRGVAAAKLAELGEDEQRKRLITGEAVARQRLTERGKLVQCPVCGAQALIQGDIVAESEPRLEEDDIVEDLTILPTRFDCFSCELELPTYGALQALELGGQFRGERRVSAVEYYSLEMDPADYYEPEYGND